MEDNEIIELYKQRSQSAVPETDKKYGKFCRMIAGNILKNNSDTDECINDTYLKISFYCFLILVVLDAFLSVFGFFFDDSKDKNFRVYADHSVRFAAEVYIVICLFFQVMKGSIGSVKLISSEEKA